MYPLLLKLALYAENTDTCRHVVSARELETCFTLHIDLFNQLICGYFGEIIDHEDPEVVKEYCDMMCDVSFVFLTNLNVEIVFSNLFLGMQVSRKDQATQTTTGKYSPQIPRPSDASHPTGPWSRYQYQYKLYCQLVYYFDNSQQQAWF